MIAMHICGDARCFVVDIADQNRLGRTDHDAGGLETDIDAVGAEVALFGRMIFRIDEDCIVRTRGDTCLAPDAVTLVEIDDTVGTPVHGCRGTRRHARRIVALVAAGDLKRSPRLGKQTDSDVLDVGAGHRERDFVL